MKKCFYLLSLLLIFSCSEEQLESENSENWKVLPECSGYGIFENNEYDCGWKVGYEDWVAHYNFVVNSGYPECYKIRVVSYTYNGEPRVSLGWQTIDNARSIIQEAQNNNQTYYNNLFLDPTPNDRQRGQRDAYLTARNYQPFAANDSGGCN